MSQTINISISGTFPNYAISFDSTPQPVPYGKTDTIGYEMATPGFSIVAVNMQRDPFSSADQLIWAIPTGGQSLILTDNNTDKVATTFGVEIVFADKSGNMFSSPDPEVINEGEG